MSVSVVIPAYNRAHRLPDAIASVLRQGQADLEIVVVDDGSTDNTREVAEAYGTIVKYVYQANAGAGAARNTGIRHATKEFIAFLDSDDRWHDFKLSVQLAMFEACPSVGLVFSDFEIETPGSGSVPHGASIWAGRTLTFPAMKRLTLARPEGESWPSDSLECWVGAMYQQLLDELPILTSSVIIRRSALADRTWYSERVATFEDWEFFAQVARNADVGYITAATTVNVGHADPGRLSKCSALERAQSYQALIERVWLADPAFVGAHGVAARSRVRPGPACRGPRIGAGRTPRPRSDGDARVADLRFWRAPGVGGNLLVLRDRSRRTGVVEERPARTRARAARDRFGKAHLWFGQSRSLTRSAMTGRHWRPASGRRCWTMIGSRPARKRFIATRTCES